jgi:hypothetical protein
MDKQLKERIDRLFPELASRYHLPVFAEVVAVRETPAQGVLCDEFRPYYAVDVQVLDEHGKPDEAWPVLQDVVLSVPVAGHEMGHFAYPENGAWVELAFAYGSPNRPFIRSVLPHRLSLPPLQRGEQRWQHNSASFQRIDKDGNHERKTDVDIHDESLKRLVEAVINTEDYHQSSKTTASNDTEVIGALKLIKALGAMQLLSGGSLDVASTDKLRLTTQADLLIKALGNINQSVDGDINSETAGKQHFEADKSWMGSSDENIFGMMGELMAAIIQLCDVLKTHTHPSTGTIIQASGVSAARTLVNGIKERLEPIIE